MNFLNKLERKFGRYALSNLTLYIIGTYVAGYLIQTIASPFISYLTLEPALILRGQVWRLVSWLLIPPGQLSIFTLITLFFYYSVGVTLERTWGDFRYNLYIFTGILMTIVGAFILALILGTGVVGYGALFSTYYISMSILLAYTATYPNAMVLFMMFIPLKMKWLGILYALMLVVEMVQANWPVRVTIICSLMNFIIFFLLTRKKSAYHPGEIRRRRQFQQAVHKSQVTNGITKHKCAICGRTEKDGDHLEFRFCSKCNGNYEYCQDHLFTHTHVQ